MIFLLGMIIFGPFHPSSFMLMTFICICSCISCLQISKQCMICPLIWIHSRRIILRWIWRRTWQLCVLRENPFRHFWNDGYQDQKKGHDCICQCHGLASSHSSTYLFPHFEEMVHGYTSSFQNTFSVVLAMCAPNYIIWNPWDGDYFEGFSSDHRHNPQISSYYDQVSYP